MPLLTPGPSNLTNCRVKVLAWLDGVGVTSLSDVSDNVFTIIVPNWKPKNLEVEEVREDRIKIYWQNYSGFNYDSIQIFRKPDLSGNNEFRRIAKVSGYSQDYIDYSVELNKTYFYKVRAWKSGFPSEFSNIVSATTVLNKPTNLQATSSYPYNSVYLTWKDNSNYETGYEVWKKGLDNIWRKIATLGQNAQSYTDATISPSTSNAIVYHDGKY